MATNGVFHLPSGCRSSLLRTAYKPQALFTKLNVVQGGTAHTSTRTARPHLVSAPLYRRHFHPSLTSSSVIISQREVPIPTIIPKTPPPATYEPPKTGILSLL